RRADGRCQHGAGPYCPYLRAGALCLCRPAQGEHARRRHPFRCGAHGPDLAGAGAAGGDDRPLHRQPARLSATMGARSWTGILLLCLLLPVMPTLAQPNDAEQARAELKQAEQEISRLKKLLDSVKQEASGLEKELQDSEREIGRLRRESSELEQQIREGESRLHDLQQQAQALQVALEAQQEQIARQVRAAYMAGRQDYLKMVLNMDDPSRVARMLRYYGYVSRARVEEIE